MKTRVFPSILVAASVFSLSGIPPVDWERVGENWGSSLQHTKDGIKRLSGKTVTANIRLYGHSVLEQVTAQKNLTCYGYAELTGIKVHGVTTMYGPMKAQGSTFHDIDIRCYNEMIGKGIVTLEDCSMDKLTLNGVLHASHCTMKQLVTFGAETVLTDSTIQEMAVMNATLPRNEKAVVVLENTIINGPVAFSQRGGVIICRGTSEVRGPIENGRISKE